MDKSRNHLKMLATAFGLLVFGVLSAQQQISLKSALKYTIDHHASVKKAQLEIAKGNELVRQSLSTGLPQVNAGVTFLNNAILQTNFVPAEFVGGPPGELAPLKFGANWNTVAGVELSQMVYSQTWLLGLRATRELADFYKLVLEKNKDQVAADVAKLYFQVQLSRTQKGIFEANISQIKGLLTLTQKQFENGFGKKLDVDRLKVQQSNLEMQVANLDLQIKQAEQALKFAMNMPLETEIVLSDTISANMFEEVNAAIAQPNYLQKNDLLILKKQSSLYQLDVERWKAGYYPSVSFFGNYNYQWVANSLGDFTKEKTWTDYSQLGLRVNIPIFDGFYKKSMMQTAQLNILQTEQDYNFAKLGLQLSHEAAITALRVNQNNLQTILATQKVAEEVYSVAQSRYREGLAPITELLDAETSLRQTQSNYITALAQIKLAEIDILAANGLLVKMAE